MEDLKCLHKKRSNKVNKNKYNKNIKINFTFLYVHMDAFNALLLNQNEI